jgi:amino acid adenylation domain-containing protein
MTYAELDHKASRLALHLQTLGVGPESVVAICLERGFEYVIAALAVWKAGGGYLPLDPHWPAERRNFIVEDAQALVAITCAPLKIKARYVVDLSTGYQESNCVFEAAPVNRENLAYVIYTSGSTGQPKGVEVTHGNLLNLIFWHRRTFGVTAEDRATFLAGLGFDAAVWELWPYLTAGAGIAITPEDIRTSADLLRQWLASHDVTVSFVPTALAEPMISAQWPATAKLRYLLTGADTLHRYPNNGLPFQLVNNYGPTECTVVTTSCVVDPIEKEELPAIGAPIANTFVYLLNERFQPVAPGETGEIYIGGTSVARGYRNRTGLTAERFFEDPFRIGKGRMYRTGDLGSVQPDGQFAFHGRTDSQEKIRGHRVELDEITGVLASHPAVSEGAVVARASGGQEKQLVAYVVPKAGAELTAHEIRELLATRLPEYMIPVAFVKLSSLPLNANGKLDREALPAPAPSNALSFSDYRAPEAPIEVAVAQILRELLDLRRVGLDDNFFLLGGHSLLGTQLVLRLRDQFGLDLTLRHLFEAQTLEKLSQTVEKMLIEKLVAMSDDEAARLLEEIQPR